MHAPMVRQQAAFSVWVRFSSTAALKLTASAHLSLLTHGFRRWRRHAPDAAANTRLSEAAERLFVTRARRATLQCLWQHAERQRRWWRRRRVLLARALQQWMRTLAVDAPQFRLRSRVRRWRARSGELAALSSRAGCRVLPRSQLALWRLRAAQRALLTLATAVLFRHRARSQHRALVSLQLHARKRTLLLRFEHAVRSVAINVRLTECLRTWSCTLAWSLSQRLAQRAALLSHDRSATSNVLRRFRAVQDAAPLERGAARLRLRSLLRRFQG